MAEPMGCSGSTETSMDCDEPLGFVDFKKLFTEPPYDENAAVQQCRSLNITDNEIIRIGKVQRMVDVPKEGLDSQLSSIPGLPLEKKISKIEHFVSKKGKKSIGLESTEPNERGSVYLLVILSRVDASTFSLTICQLYGSQNFEPLFDNHDCMINVFRCIAKRSIELYSSGVGRETMGANSGHYAGHTDGFAPKAMKSVVSDHKKGNLSPKHPQTDDLTASIEHTSSIQVIDEIDRKETRDFIDSLKDSFDLSIEGAMHLEKCVMSSAPGSYATFEQFTEIKKPKYALFACKIDNPRTFTMAIFEADVARTGKHQSFQGGDIKALKERLGIIAQGQLRARADIKFSDLTLTQ